MLKWLLVILALAAPAPVFSAPQPTHYIDVTLTADTLSPRPGSSILLGLNMTPRPGWHGYWSNAGESGLPPTVWWSAPPGVKFGPLQHPAPTLLRVMGLTSYVHTGPHILLARMTLNRSMARGTPLPVTANVSFAICSDRLCVPQTAKLTVRLKAGDGRASTDAALLRRALAEEPKVLSAGMFDVEAGQLVLKLPVTAHLDGTKTHFFPDQNGFFDPLRARSIPGHSIRIVSPAARVTAKTISGVVSDGSSAFRVSFHRALSSGARPH